MLLYISPKLIVVWEQLTFSVLVVFVFYPEITVIPTTQEFCFNTLYDWFGNIWIMSEPLYCDMWLLWAAWIRVYVLRCGSLKRLGSLFTLLIWKTDWKSMPREEATSPHLVVFMLLIIRTVSVRDCASPMHHGKFLHASCGFDDSFSLT